MMIKILYLLLWPNLEKANPVRKLWASLLTLKFKLRSGCTNYHHH